MPSSLRQLNVRLDAASAAIWDVIVPRVEAALGVELSQAQIVGMALKALAEKFPAPNTVPSKTARPRRSK